MPRFLGAVSAAMVLVITTGTGFADDTSTSGQKPEQAVRKLLTEMEDGFNRGDAKALAACWTPRGDFIGQAGRIEGRDNIEKGFRDAFSARKQSTIQLHVLSLRVANEGLALVDAIADMKPPTAPRGGEPGFNLILVKHDGRWLIESARETISRAPSQPQHLKALEWMVGDWAEEAAAQNDVSLRSTCDWTANRAFLIRKFKAERKGGDARAGTEVIGWDPRAMRIRSWVFDFDGGFGENLWVEDGNRWLLKYSGILADGSEVSSTTIITSVDANTMTFQSKDRTANGRRVPDVPEFTVHRQPVATNASKSDGETKPRTRVQP